MRPQVLATFVLVCASATAAAQPSDVQYVGHTSSPDLPLAECKDGVRYVVVQGRVADGGKVTLTLDPNGSKYNEFGDEVAGGKKSPVVTLECTLKLVKKENAMMGQAHFSRRGNGRTAEETDVRDGVVRGTERPGRDEGLVAIEETGDAMDLGALDCFLE